MKKKRRKTKMHEKCLTPGCGENACSRGICRKCYNFLQSRMKVVQALTWDLLADNGMCYRTDPDNPTEGEIPILIALGKAELLHVDDVIDKFNEYYNVPVERDPSILDMRDIAERVINEFHPLEDEFKALDQGEFPPPREVLIDPPEPMHAENPDNDSVIDGEFTNEQVARGDRRTKDLFPPLEELKVPRKYLDKEW